MSPQSGGVTREGVVGDGSAGNARMWDAGGRQGAGRRGRRRGRGGGREGGEQPTVPPAEFRSYYGRPILKSPVWKHDIPAYLFTGGVAAGSSLLAAGAEARGMPVTRIAGRAASLGAISASTYFLIHDLGRPDRFYNMLRVAKPTSPMSMGTWILAVFGPASGVAAVSEAAPLLPRHGLLGLARIIAPPVGSVAGWVAALASPALASYTAVLIADTAVPSWHEGYRELPFVFTGSALASGAGVGLLTAPLHEQGPAQRMAIAGAALELGAELSLTRRHGVLSEPYEHGKPARLLRASQVLTVGGVAGALLGRRSRVATAVSGAALLLGSLATRFGVYEGGVASSKDPKYVVIPQRERLAARAVGNGHLDHAPEEQAPAARGPHETAQ